MKTLGFFRLGHSRFDIISVFMLNLGGAEDPALVSSSSNLASPNKTLIFKVPLIIFIYELCNRCDVMMMPQMLSNVCQPSVHMIWSMPHAWSDHWLSRQTASIFYSLCMCWILSPSMLDPFLIHNPRMVCWFLSAIWLDWWMVMLYSARDHAIPVYWQWVLQLLLW